MGVLITVYASPSSFIECLSCQCVQGQFKGLLSSLDASLTAIFRPQATVATSGAVKLCKSMGGHGGRSQHLPSWNCTLKWLDARVDPDLYLGALCCALIISEPLSTRRGFSRKSFVNAILDSAPIVSALYRSVHGGSFLSLDVVKNTQGIVQLE